MHKVEIQREEIGYVLDDYFISKDIWNTITVHKPISEETLGFCYKGNVTVDNKDYKDIITILTIENYSKVLQLLETHGIVVRKFLFLTTKTNLIEKDIFNLSSFWYSVDYPNIYMIMNTETNKKEGYILTIDSVYLSRLYIGLFEVFEKNKGIGTEIIQELKQYKQEIKGLTTPHAKPFWTRLGAKYEEDNIHFRI